MKIRVALISSAVAVLVGATAYAGVDPTLPNIVPVFPDRPGLTAANNFVITNRLGTPTVEFEILTVNIGGQDWVRPPINRDVTCTSPIQYFRMPETHEFTVYWFDPAQGIYVQVDQRRKRTICIWDYGTFDHQFDCLQQHGRNFNCQCDSPMYGPGTGNGVSVGFADAYYRGLTGQWASLAGYTGDFLLTVEYDPDSLLQADDLLDRERDATHADNTSFAYFTWDGTGVPNCTTPSSVCGGQPCPCASNVVVAYSFNPVCM